MLLHVFLNVWCNLIEQVSHTCPSIEGHMTGGKHWRDHRNREAYMGVLYHITQALPALLVILNEATLYPIVSVHYILYTVLRLYY